MAFGNKLRNRIVGVLVIVLDYFNFIAGDDAGSSCS